MSRSDDPQFKRTRGFVGWCEPCDKKTYATRKSARRAAKHVADGMQAYRCPTEHALWHYGHIPPDVRNGTYDKDEWLRRVR